MLNFHGEQDDRNVQTTQTTSEFDDDLDLDEDFHALRALSVIR